MVFNLHLVSLCMHVPGSLRISHRSKGSNYNSNFTSFIMRLCCVDKFAALLDGIQVFHGLYRWISMRDFSAVKLLKCASGNYKLLCILL